MEKVDGGSDSSGSDDDDESDGDVDSELQPTEPVTPSPSTDRVDNFDIAENGVNDMSERIASLEFLYVSPREQRERVRERTMERGSLIFDYLGAVK